jgi:DNA primase catalytic subunit
VVFVKYMMPKGMQPSTLEERQSFYAKEFQLEKVAEWLAGRGGKTWFAVIIGRHTDIYPQAYQEDKDTTIIIDNYSDLENVRRQILEFLPEAAYYDRNVYDESNRILGQELAFDLDPENVVCPVHGSLADKLARGQGLGFCEIELGMVKEQTVRLWERLEKTYAHLRVTYSGRGFHLHVLDQKTYGLSSKERAVLAEQIKKEGFSIDTWVTEGEMRLIRLPYSLHGMVSRIAIPLQKKEIEKFNPLTDERCIPEFLKKKKGN